MNIPTDKQYHLAAGLAITLSVGMYDLVIALWLCVTLAVGKELLDFLTGKGTPEFGDIFATIVGGIFGIVVLLIIGV